MGGDLGIAREPAQTSLVAGLAVSTSPPLYLNPSQDHDLVVPLIPLRVPGGIEVVVVVIVSVVNMYTALRDTRRKALEPPLSGRVVIVVIIVTGEIGLKIVGPEVAPVVVVKVVVSVGRAEFIRGGIIDRDKKLIAVVIILTTHIEFAGDSPVVSRTGYIEMDMGIFGIVAIGIDLFVFGVVTSAVIRSRG